MGNSLKDNEFDSLSFFVVIKIIQKERGIIMSMSMNFDLFKESLIQILQEDFGKDYRVFADSVTKNNGVELTGIIIKEEGKNASPTIYIDELYEEYQRGVSVKRIAQTIKEIYSENCYSETVDLQRFHNYETAKAQIAFKLINKEKNEKLLSKVPHKEFYNLAIVFYYAVTEPPFFGKASILITNAHLTYWKVEEETLFQNAIRHTPILFPAQIQNIEDVMRGFLQKELSQRETIDRLMIRIKKELLDIDKVPMYVLTNKQKVQGAACMLYPEVVRNFAKSINKNLYILPSSIHEVILLPEDAGNNKEELLSMVTEINATQVDECETLADSVYFYHLEKDSLERLC